MSDLTLVSHKTLNQLHLATKTLEKVIQEKRSGTISESVHELVGLRPGKHDTSITVTCLRHRGETSVVVRESTAAYTLREDHPEAPKAGSFQTVSQDAVAFRDTCPVPAGLRMARGQQCVVNCRVDLRRFHFLDEVFRLWSVPLPLRQSLGQWKAL